MESVCGGTVWAAFMGESGGKGGILIEKPLPGCGAGL
jgi:hypothetical protein